MLDAKIKVLRFFIASLLAMCLNDAFSQNGCDDITLNEASKNYDIGNFQEVTNSLQPCVAKGFNFAQKIEAYRLIAISNLAIDSVAAATRASAELLEINPTFVPYHFDPPKFRELIENIKNQHSEQMVTSVSKKAENVLEAPATVIIITAEEIVNRGYQDIEQIFHDLPGFDISKGRGANYSNLYQRGYRSILTDRTILLIDGVEQNDLSSDNAPISRQYPLSNVKRVEVVYGPASTMYGANAFVGVINIVTKDNSEMVNQEKGIGLNINSNYSSLDTRFIDAVIVGKNNDISFSITGRYFQSNEMDLSKYKTWDSDYSNIDYNNVMNISGIDEDGNYLANSYIQRTGLDTLPASNYYTITYNENNQATGISLTEAGVARAIELDENALNSDAGTNPLGFDASTTDWYIKGKLQIKKYTFAIESWKTDEGLAPWYNDSEFVFRNNRSRWINWNSNFYLNYENQLTEKLHFTCLTSYRLHSINGGTNFETFNGYFNGVYNFYELATDSLPTINTTYYYRTSNQIKNEMRFLWSPNNRIDVMSGIEFRNSLIQGDYLKSSLPDPDETGTITERGILGTDHFRVFDLGIYSQAKIEIFKDVNCVLGGRVDNNRIRQNGGYGTVFNPRIAVTYSPRSFIFKAIYATAFKDASYLQKYATVKGTRELPNPTLEPEKVKNIELSAFWKASKGLIFDVAAFRADYSDVVGTVNVTLDDGTTTGQFQPIGKQQIVGLQSTAKYSFDKYSMWANYTFTNPIDKTTDLRISDIASHRFNLGANAVFFKHLNVNFRSNYVGARKSGMNTSGSEGPVDLFDAYMVFHATLGYVDLIKGLTIQVGSQNIFDKEYFDPGVREASGNYASMIPQQGRMLMVKLLYHIK
jgi:outer membrane receptor for ferrienterochelin and colicins